MNGDDQDFFKKLRKMFHVEATEHLQEISSALAALKQGMEPAEEAGLIETAFREIHSLKGASRAVKLPDIEYLCQAMESLLSALKHKKIKVSSQGVDILEQAADTLAEIVSLQETGKPGPGCRDIKGIGQQLAALLSGNDKAKPQPESVDLAEPSVPASSARIIASAPKEEDEGVEAEVAVSGRVSDAIPGKEKVGTNKKEPVTPATVRISIDKLDQLLLQAEEMLAFKQMARQRVMQVRNIISMFDQWQHKYRKIMPELRQATKMSPQQAAGQSLAADQPTRITDFFSWEQVQTVHLGSALNELATATEYDSRTIDSMVDTLLTDMKQCLMLPFSHLTNIFPLFVRELARDQGKEVSLSISGGNIEIDRRILEEMKDPLIHLIRNCIDHGAEKPEERIQGNKPRRARISLTISSIEGDKVEILIADDGMGINGHQVREAAIRRGVISRQEADDYTGRDDLGLIFQSGVSTSPIITEISGHGVGLAIVREKVEKLDGLISLESGPGRGTTFRIVIPLTLATFRGVLVQTADQFVIIPTSNVERLERVNREDVHTVEGIKTITIDHGTVPLVRLGDVLQLAGVPQEGGDETLFKVLILGTAEKRIAFRVEKVLNEQEVLLKSLGPQLARVRNVSGATIIESGQVVPILNVQDLMKSAVSLDDIPHMAVEQETRELRKSILVVEDSITSRMLLKNIFESAGYLVTTAVDGVDALGRLRSEEFNLMVSDIDMPRMDGFVLTGKIRQNKKFADLPVVLVTTLDSREDRERGIEVGADAYIVKSSFEQSNLLEIVERLVP